MESVNDLAQLEQIGEPAEAARLYVAFGRKRQLVLARGVKVGPVRGNKRAAAIGQHHQQSQNAAAFDAADNRQATPFECVPLARNGH